MDELLYNTLLLYFKTLSLVGYKSYNTVYKILVIQFIYELLDGELRYHVTKKDIKLMQDLLYQFIGSTCEISFPSNCLCACTHGPSTEDPSVDSFALIPNTTSYVGSQPVTFTGATYRINNVSKVKENSLKIYWGSEVMAENQSVEGVSLTFDTPITKNLVAGQSYTAKASVEDENGVEYFSNNFVITCTAIPVDNPSITNFKLRPATTSYTGTQDVTFLGATFTIHKGDRFKDNSLEIIWGSSEVMGTGLSTAGSSVDFSSGIKKNLVQGNTYTARASVQDTDGNKYYSNVFTITVAVPVDPTWMYTGNTADKPTESEILAGNKYDYKSLKEFETPTMTLKTIWVCLPATVTLLTMENANQPGDFLYNPDIDADFLTHEDVTIEGVAYKLHYMKSVIATMNPYITKVQ